MVILNLFSKFENLIYMYICMQTHIYIEMDFRDETIKVYYNELYIIFNYLKEGIMREVGGRERLID